MPLGNSGVGQMKKAAAMMPEKTSATSMESAISPVSFSSPSPSRKRCASPRFSPMEQTSAVNSTTSNA